MSVHLLVQYSNGETQSETEKREEARQSETVTKWKGFVKDKYRHIRVHAHTLALFRRKVLQNLPVSSFAFMFTSNSHVIPNVICVCLHCD